MLRAPLIGLSALTINPMRTVLSTLGIIIGVGALVAILALGDGLERFSREQIESTTDLQTVTVSVPTNDRIDGILVRRDSVTVFSRSDLESLRARIGGLANAYRVLTGSTSIRPPDSTREVGVLVRAVDVDAPVEESAAILYGGVDDWRSHRDSTSAVLSRATAEVLFPGASSAAPGQPIGLADRTLLVAAVLDGDPAERPLQVFVPLVPSSVAWLGATGRVPEILLTASRIEDVETVVRETGTWSRERFPEAGINVRSSLARVGQASRALLVFKLGLGSIAAISLLVGGIGIMNILLASVSERTREIGIRKSVGARDGDIRRQFLAESVAITCVGSVIGILFGMAGAVTATAVIRSITDAPIQATFTWPSILVAAGTAVCVGMVFGTYPARKAGRMSPIDAIRHE